MASQSITIRTVEASKPCHGRDVYTWDMATTSEHLFPVLLVFGLFTRAAALALFGMTMVIQIFVYPDAWWTEHSLWMAMQLALIVRGAGLFSLDALLSKSRRA